MKRQFKGTDDRVVVKVAHFAYASPSLGFLERQLA
jgi:hypothetical protein